MHALLAAIILFGLVNLASAQIMPPPARYDHPYRGRLDVIRTEAALQAPVPSPESAVCRRRALLPGVHVARGRCVAVRLASVIR
jgi:hypothetical protein